MTLALATCIVLGIGEATPSGLDEIDANTYCQLMVSNFRELNQNKSFFMHAKGFFSLGYNE